jgi:hypothetical protein
VCVDMKTVLFTAFAFICHRSKFPEKKRQWKLSSPGGD